MLFRKKQPRACCYCIHGTTLNEGQILCVKRGIRDENSSCRKFCYDPCKRIPPKPKSPDFTQYEQDDFSL